MRVALLVVLLAACSEQSKPNTPRDAVRGFVAAMGKFDYDAMLPFVKGDETDLEFMDAYFESLRTAHRFRTEFIAAYGEDGWAEFNDNEGARLLIPAERDLGSLDQVRYEMHGNTATGTLPDDPRKLYLVSDGRRWSIDLRKSMGPTELQMRQGTVLFRAMAALIRDAIPRIGADGVTPATLDSELGMAMLSAYAEAERIQ